MKSNREVYVKNDIMNFIIKCCRGENKRQKKNRWIQKEKKNSDYEISQCEEHTVRSKIGKILANEKILEEYCVKVYEIDLDCKFIRINISKENYDADYEIGRIQTFISKLRNKKSRELEKENEELKEKIIKDGEKKLEK